MDACDLMLPLRKPSVGAAMLPPVLLVPATRSLRRHLVLRQQLLPPPPAGKLGSQPTPAAAAAAAAAPPAGKLGRGPEEARQLAAELASELSGSARLADAAAVTLEYLQVRLCRHARAPPGGPCAPTCLPGAWEECGGTAAVLVGSPTWQPGVLLGAFVSDQGNPLNVLHPLKHGLYFRFRNHFFQAHKE